EDLLSEDFEFYHDKVGIDKSKASFINSIKNGLCGTGENSTRRELIESSLQVFPLYDNSILYGAIQKGIHRFHDTIARFTHVWLLENGKWTISRALSYDHKND
ncbi:MAG: nuclear transport factor 2 family protein, partial [Bacteroidota bacterium]